MNLRKYSVTRKTVERPCRVFFIFVQWICRESFLFFSFWSFSSLVSIDYSFSEIPSNLLYPRHGTIS